MINDLWVILPEIVLLSLACCILVADLYCAKKSVITYLFSQGALVITALCCWKMYGMQATAFHDQVILDPLSCTLKMIILALMFLVLVYSRPYIKTRDIAYGEFHILALFTTLGMMFLVSAQSLLMIYLGLELLSLPLYAMVALQRDTKVAAEAGMKYFVMGALASGMLLYGISLLYGLSGSIQLTGVAEFIRTVQGSSLQVALFALVFIIVGLAFKLGAAPFHMWVPDIYQGAPTNVTLLIGSAPKVAAFGMAFRLLHDTLPGFAVQWSHIFIGLAILSMALGNIIAIAQTNVKRLLAYSTIAHVGFLFLGLLVAPQVGYTPALFYIVTYAFVAIAGFGILIALSNNKEAQTLEDLKGLGQRSPWLAFVMLLVAFSLAGVPPTIGFYAKFTILTALVQAGMTWLAAVAVMFSIIGAYYYIKIVRVMYFDKAEDMAPVSGGPVDFKAVLSINGLAVVGLGLFPAPLFMICQQVFSKLN